MAQIILIEIVDLFDWEPLKRNSRAQLVFEELDPTELRQVTEAFANYILNFFKSLILNAIHTQKFPVRYQPLSPKYVQRKRKKGWKLGFWEMTGFLQQHLTYWKYYGNNYAIGFKEGVVHPISGTPILTIAKVLERGSVARNIPARPLFKPLATAISKKIYDIHFKRFLRTKYPDLYDKMMEV